MRYFSFFLTALIIYLYLPGIALAGNTLWQFQSIDTMKYSRDIAKEMLNNDSFNETIDRQVQIISSLGATHVAIATPYDAEFLPFLAKWVQAARKYNLNIWLKGNFSGWEGWFGYPAIDRSTHILKTKEFIINNSDLFKNGDIFSSCPECENGGPGDPRFTKDVIGYRNFLINEYETTKKIFAQIGKEVRTNVFPMNGDVAKLIMDKNTTQALDDLVCIDHYTASPDQFAEDIEILAKQSGGKIVLGEFGAPIPDINGKMNDSQQAEFVQKLLLALYKNKNLVAGVNYWTLTGGSTKLVNTDLTPRPAAGVIKNFFQPTIVSGTVTDPVGRPIGRALITTTDGINEQSNAEGKFSFPVPFGQTITIKAKAENYQTFAQKITTGEARELSLAVRLNPQTNNLLQTLMTFLKKLEAIFDRWGPTKV